MTMIELVAALALFVIILGSLMIIMDTATSLWSSSRSQQREQTVAQNLFDLLTDDLQHAVTDVASNAPATFILDSRPGQSANVQIVLQFARQASPHSRTVTGSGVPLSLEAVFYTFFDNALFRHVIPLSYPAFDAAEPLGQLIDDQRPNVTGAALHRSIRDYLRDPIKYSKPAANWNYALLAERVDVLDLPASLPAAYAREESRTTPPARSVTATVPQLPEYEYLETDVLPDHINVTIRLNSEEDWNTLQTPATTEETKRKRELLGLRFSKRITFPAQGGSRLP